MYKDKCSNPIVICNLCNGTRPNSSYSCDVCGEKFAETYQLDQHKEKAHKIDQVRRRSSRLSQQKSAQVLYGEDGEGSDNEY